MAGIFVLRFHYCPTFLAWYGGTTLYSRQLHLRKVNLRNQDLRGLNLQSGADLRGTHLENADLSNAFGLTQAQVDSAYGDEDTKLPPGIVMPESWKKKLGPQSK